MARPYPNDVIVIDTDGLLHARVVRGKKDPQIRSAKAFRYSSSDVFKSAVVTPELVDEAAFADAIRRLKLETGRWDRASVLLPDSWFRINLVDLPALSDRPNEALHAVRWSLKRTLPIAPETLRVAYEVLSRNGTAVKLVVLSAVEATLAAIERLFVAAGIEIVLIEPIGLNIWNAVAVREQPTTKDRIFVYLRQQDFTTAVFRGAQPLFIRSRNLSGDRSVHQELRLSAGYLRDAMQAVNVERCYLATSIADPEIQTALAAEFNAPVVPIELQNYVEQAPARVPGMDAELVSCAGVFTG